MPGPVRPSPDQQHNSPGNADLIEICCSTNLYPAVTGIRRHRAQSSSSLCRQMLAGLRFSWSSGKQAGRRWALERLDTTNTAGLSQRTAPSPLPRQKPPAPESSIRWVACNSVRCYSLIAFQYSATSGIEPAKSGYQISFKTIVSAGSGARYPALTRGSRN